MMRPFSKQDNPMSAWMCIMLVLMLLSADLFALNISRPGHVPVPVNYVKADIWQETLLASRSKALAADVNKDEIGALWARLDRDFPIPSDWVLQDLGDKRDALFAAEIPPDLSRELFAKVCTELGIAAKPITTALAKLVAAKVPLADRRWLDLYVSACEQRRAKRLATLIKQAPHIAFTKHFNMAGSHYAYTEAQSDGLAERNWFPGSQLCRLDMVGIYGQVKGLIDDAKGVIRDPNVSWDGKRLLFAWKKDDRADDYHLYEMDLGSEKMRQLTFGLGYADYEGAYLPNGDIIFNTTRCVQTVDCFVTEVSNLYSCDKDGGNIHRLGYDQVHTNYPQVLDDGRVTYTRWEYNDRGQLFPQPLFQMNPDGTGQTEYYGNNSWFPTSILHARGIPGTQRVVAIASGHHSSQAGKLIIVNPAKGRQEAEGVQFIAPVRETKAVRIDTYGQDGEQFMYPYALNEREFILSYWADDGHRLGRDRFAGWYNIVYMDIDGRREVLASDPELSCHQPVPLVSRPTPKLRPSTVNYSQTTGSYYMQDVYLGPGLAGVARGAAKKLRVVTLDYRAAPVRGNHNNGPAGAADVSTAIGAKNASWDPKSIIGDATIYADGSAYFEVPARTPVYFQVLDDKNRVINTMRSWSTLMPGERFACTGCHESKNAAPPNYKSSQALSKGMEKLKPFYGPIRGFSFRREVQPILDRKCISCHSDRDKQMSLVKKPEHPQTDISRTVASEKSFSLLGEGVLDKHSGRCWSDAYLALTSSRGKRANYELTEEPTATCNALVSWMSPQSTPPLQGPYSCGSARSSLMDLLAAGHGKVTLTPEERDKIAAWIDLGVPFCGDYIEANHWDDHERANYLRCQSKRLRQKEIDRVSVRAMARAGGKDKAPSSDSAVRVEFLGADDAGLVHLRNPAKPGELTINRSYRHGDRLVVAGARYMMVKFDAALPEKLIDAPDGYADFAIPVGKNADPKAVFSGAIHQVSARVATEAEIQGDR